MMKFYPEHKNITEIERWLSIFCGGALAIYSAKKRRPVAAAAAAILIWRGATGKSLVYSVLNLNTKAPGEFEVKPQPIQIARAITINRAPNQLYEFWRNFENLPLFLQHLDYVHADGLRQSHWVGTGATGHVFEWDVLIETDIPDEMITWHSIDSDLQHAGFVQFEPALNGEATNLRLNLAFTPPAGRLGILAEKMFGEDPKEQIFQDLQALKRLMEIGNVIPLEDRLASKDLSAINSSIDQRKRH